MNPLAWKREHQIALAFAVIVGGVIGLIIGVYVTPSYVSFRWGALWCSNGPYSCIYLLQGHWLLILFWAVMCGCLGGVLVYIRQLLRE